MKRALEEFDLNTDVLIGSGSVFKGEVITEGAVIISAGASIVGNITAKTMIVAGSVTQGNIYVDRELRIIAGAVIHCDSKAGSLKSENGAIFNGCFELL